MKLTTLAEGRSGVEAAGISIGSLGFHRKIDIIQDKQ